MEASTFGGPPPLSVAEFPALSSSFPPRPPLAISPDLPPVSTLHSVFLPPSGNAASPAVSTASPPPPSFIPLRTTDATISPPASSVPQVSHPATETPALLWKDLFIRSSSSPRTYLSPEYTEDGVPVVRAPSSVLLKTSEAYKGFLICHFFSPSPPLKKIFADLNAVWGKTGAITLQPYTSRSVLILIPDVAIRSWALKVGFWSAGTVAFSVSPWTPSASLASQPLTSTPVWMSFHSVPPQLRSSEGVDLIASGVGSPVPPATDSQQSFSTAGLPKVRAVVRLDRGPLPASVIVRDDGGEEALIGV